MRIETPDAERLMKKCQIGCRNYSDANNLLADCYGTIGALVHERDALAAKIQQLQEVVTYDAERKETFIARVRGILSAEHGYQPVSNPLAQTMAPPRKP